jgi:hypothetical protein
MTIDWAQMESPDMRAARAVAEREGVAKAECYRRIIAVVDEMAQLNLASVAAAGLLPAPDLAVYIAGLEWVAAMRAAWPAAARADNATDDALWPPVPAGVAELGGRF